MKRISLLIMFVVSVPLLAQESVNYTITYDDPNLYPKYIVNLKYIGFDMYANSIDAWNINVGLWGRYEPKPGMGVEASVNPALLTMSFAPKLASSLEYTRSSAFSTEVGAYYALTSSNVTRNTRVTLESEYTSDLDGDDFLFSKSIRVPATWRVETMVRTGFSHLSAPLGEDGADDEVRLPIVGDFAMAYQNSLYLGVGIRFARNVFIRTSYGKNHTSEENFIYLDALIPSTTFREPANGGADVTDAVKEVRDAFPVGFRVVAKMYDIEDKSRTGRTFSANFPVELGYRPYLGWYVGVGMSGTLFKEKVRTDE